MFEIIQFLPEHIENFEDPHDIYVGSLSTLKSQAEFLYKSPACHTVSLVLDGRVEGVLGLTLFWEGNADCWTMLSKKACQHPITLHRLAMRIMGAYTENLKLRRLSAGTPIDQPEGSRWLETLGFKREGVMVKYGPDGKDWVLYARTN